MLSLLSKNIAYRYLTAKKSEATISLLTIFAILGVMIGVAVLTVVMAVMTGFETELKNKILGTDSHINIRSVSGNINNWEELLEKIKTVEGVKSVSPYTYHQALLQVSDRATGIIIKGITSSSASGEQVLSYVKDKSQGLFTSSSNKTVIKEIQKEQNLNLESESTEENTQEELVNTEKIVIGKGLADSFNLKEGALISLLSPQVGSTPFGLMPRFKRLEISNIYSSGLVEYEQGLAYIDLPTAQTFFRMNNGITGFEIRVYNIDQANIIAKNIMNTISSRGLYAQDWTITNKPFFEALKLEQRVYFIVLLLIIVMASFSIVSSLIMVVIEKRKDIAVLRTMGASRKDISNIFKIQGAVIGAIGVFLGIILGLLICFGLQYYGFPIDERIFQMSKLPIAIKPINIVLTGISAFIICYFATLYPARKAASLEAAKILRFE